MKEDRWKIGNIKVGGEVFFIAGPCVIENRLITLSIARKLREIFEGKGYKFVFKASYDKANRTSISSYRGPGLKEGLKILLEVKDKLNIPITTDVHTPNDVGIVSETVDLIQIPALLSKQTDILIEAGRSGKPVNIKKGQFMSTQEIIGAVEKVRSTGNNKIIISERGNVFGYNNLVVDYRNIFLLREKGVPVAFDATHSVQRPAIKGGSSGGERAFVIPLTRAAVALGVDAIFLEVHPHPERALSDAENSINYLHLERLIDSIKGLIK